MTPPHRVKSISMASFTAEEIELLSKHGNDYCRRVWLGTYDDKLGYPDFKDEHRVKDFMTAKYEKKKYYVDPANVEERRSTPPATSASTDRNPKPLSSLVPNVNPLAVRVLPPVSLVGGFVAFCVYRQSF